MTSSITFPWRPGRGRLRRRRRRVASLSKTQLINELVKNGTTWNRGVAMLREDRRLLAKKKQDTARDARVRPLSGKTMVDR
jgi:hypothetical protein